MCRVAAVLAALLAAYVVALRPAVCLPGMELDHLNVMCVTAGALPSSSGAGRPLPKAVCPPGKALLLPGHAVAAAGRPLFTCQDTGLSDAGAASARPLRAAVCGPGHSLSVSYHTLMCMRDGVSAPQRLPALLPTTLPAAPPPAATPSPSASPAMRSAPSVSATPAPALSSFASIMRVSVSFGMPPAVAATPGSRIGAALQRALGIAMAAGFQAPYYAVNMTITAYSPSPNVSTSTPRPLRRRAQTALAALDTDMEIVVDLLVVLAAQSGVNLNAAPALEIATMLLTAAAGPSTQGVIADSLMSNTELADALPPGVSLAELAATLARSIRIDVSSAVMVRSRRPTSSSPTGMPPAVIAAIAIGVSVGCIGLGVGVALYMRSRQQAQSKPVKGDNFTARNPLVRSNRAVTSAGVDTSAIHRRRRHSSVVSYLHPEDGNSHNSEQGAEAKSTRQLRSGLSIRSAGSQRRTSISALQSGATGHSGNRNSEKGTEAKSTRQLRGGLSIRAAGSQRRSSISALQSGATEGEASTGRPGARAERIADGASTRAQPTMRGKHIEDMRGFMNPMKVRGAGGKR